MPQNRSSANNMRRVCKRTFDTLHLDSPSLSPAERIRLLDDCTMQPDQDLQSSADQLVACLLDNSNWCETGVYLGEFNNLDPGRTTAMETGGSRPFPDEASGSERATKRQATNWPGSDQPDTQVTAAYDDPFPQYPAYFQSISGQPFPPPLRHTASSNLGEVLAANEAQPDGQAPGPSNQYMSALGSTTDSSASQSFMTYGPPVLGQEPSTIPPQVIFTQVANTLPYMSIPPHVAGPASAHTSTNTNSHDNTIFTQGPSSGQSNTHSFVEGSSQLESVINSNPTSLALRCLEQDPMVVSDEKRAKDLEGDRHGVTWARWEMNQLIRAWVSEGVPDSKLLVAMSSPKTPGPNDQVPEDWRNLSRDLYDWKRAPNTIVRKWWTMMEEFSLIVASLSSIQFESVSSVLTLLMRAISAPEPEDNKPVPKLSTADLVSWAAGGTNGWFALVYNRVRNHYDINQYVNNFRADKQPSQIRSMSRGTRRGKSTRSDGSLDPPATSASASHDRAQARPPRGKQRAQTSMSSLGDLQPIVIPANGPARTEVVRDHRLVTQARIDMANARTRYLLDCADKERFKIYERYVLLSKTLGQHALRTAREALQIPNSTPAMIAAAERTFIQQMESKLPEVEVRRILQQLEHGLPPLKELGIHPATIPPTPEPAKDPDSEEAVDALTPLSSI